MASAIQSNHTNTEEVGKLKWKEDKIKTGSLASFVGWGNVGQTSNMEIGQIWNMLSMFVTHYISASSWSLCLSNTPSPLLAPHRLVQVGNANAENHHTEVGVLRYCHGVVVARVSRADRGAGPLVGALRA